jgi:hypothetical protein
MRQLSKNKVFISSKAAEFSPLDLQNILHLKYAKNT